MSRPRHQMGPTSRRHGRPEPQPARLERKDAADLLRAARAVPVGDDAEAIDWAFLAMPDSIPARRLKIEHLLRQGDNDLADALLAQGLLQHPTNPSLTLLRARRLYAQGQVRHAEGELRIVLAARPHHCGTLELAGRVSAELGDASGAVKFLRQAAAERAGNDRVAGLLVQSLLDAGSADRAAEALRRMVRPPAGLKARVLRGMGRLLEAVELLETASEAGDDPAGPDEAFCELLDTLEDAVDLPRIRVVLEGIGLSRPVALARAGRAWLLLGEFDRAVVEMARLARLPQHRRAALGVLVVAAAMLDRLNLAERALCRLQLTEEGIDSGAMPDIWRRGLMGRLLLDQRTAGRAGSDPSPSQLDWLLEAAADALGGELAAAGPAVREADEVRRRELERHRTACLEAMGKVPPPPRPPRPGDRDAA